MNVLFFQLQLSEEKARIGILQRHENEYKKDLERLQSKATKFDDEATQAQYSVENLTRELKEKVSISSNIEIRFGFEIYF